MTPRKQTTGDEHQLADDLEAFEEFEAGGGAEEPAEAPAARQKAEEPILTEDDEELPGFADPETTAKAASQEAPPSAAKSFADELAELAPDVPVNLVAVVGKTTTSVGELIACRIGQVLDLRRAPGETVDLVANGRLIARGELVEMDGKLGVRILKLVR